MMLRAVGTIRSTITTQVDAPKQGREGGVDAWLEVDREFADALDGVAAGDEIIVITWLHEGKRDSLKVHPRDNKRAPLRGVFATRSQDRPNPLGLHPVTVKQIAGNRILIGPIETIDNTPVVDIKPALRGSPA
jgi:tRNA-Thr(GGU) m(6)t(6)A37 methyltransferase TsaA